MNITLVQPRLFWQDPIANRANIEEILGQITDPTDLIVLPETFNTGFSPEAKTLAEPLNGLSMQWMKQLSKQYSTAICGSLFIKSNQGIQNVFVYVDKSGNCQTYSKRHLFGLEKKHLNPGKHIFSIQSNGLNIGASICYDLRFPVWCRKTAQDKELLIFVANWPASRISHWNTLLKARAIENQCYVIGCNVTGGDIGETSYNGQSMIIKYDGTVLADAHDKETLIQATLNSASLTEYREKYPFLKDKDNFEIEK